MKTVAACAIVVFVGIGTAAAQPAGPYVTGHVGMTGGDGGGALITGAGVGYMSPRRLAFELEVSVSPDLDFAPQPVAILSIFPPPSFDVDGRMVWLQTNAIATLADTGKLRVAAVGGGGVVNLRRTITYDFYPYPTVTFPSPRVPVGTLLPYDTTLTGTETALSLHIGGIVDYALTQRLRVGVDARYMHAFLYDPMKAGRVTARAQWGF